jgi:Fe-S-cluster containining protein
MANFSCSRCSACCRSIGKMVVAAQCACNEAQEDLHPIIEEIARFPFTVDETTGCCPKLDHLTNLCTVYHDRPVICRTEEMWIRYWSEVMTHDEWVAEAKKSCIKLQGR